MLTAATVLLLMAVLTVHAAALPALVPVLALVAAATGAPFDQHRDHPGGGHLCAVSDSTLHAARAAHVSQLARRAGLTTVESVALSEPVQYLTDSLVR